jgi:hypothetical protein
MIGQFSLTQMDPSSDEDDVSRNPDNCIVELFDDSNNERNVDATNFNLTQGTSLAVNGLLGLARDSAASLTAKNPSAPASPSLSSRSPPAEVTPAKGTTAEAVQRPIDPPTSSSPPTNHRTEALASPSQHSSHKATGLTEVSEAHWEWVAASFAENKFECELDRCEKQLIENAICNTKKYERSNTSIETRFFDTILEFGGPELSPLCKVQQDGLLRKRRVLYIVCKGKRSDTKFYILNKCLTLCALKWTNSRTGNILESSTFVQYIKQLFTVF